MGVWLFGCLFGCLVNVLHYILHDVVCFNYADHRAISIVDVLDDIFLETNDRLAQTVFLNKEELSRNGIHYQRNNSIHDIKSQQPPPPTIRQVALAMIKYNFASVPHVLEPVDLLMIESYLTRYDAIGYMNYYMSTQPKFVYRLSGPDIASIRQDGLEETYKDSYKDKMTDDYEKLAVSCVVLCCVVL